MVTKIRKKEDLNEKSCLTIESGVRDSRGVSGPTPHPSFWGAVTGSEPGWQKWSLPWADQR